METPSLPRMYHYVRHSGRPRLGCLQPKISTPEGSPPLTSLAEAANWDLSWFGMASNKRHVPSIGTCGSSSSWTTRVMSSYRTSLAFSSKKQKQGRACPPACLVPLPGSLSALCQGSTLHQYLEKTSGQVYRNSRSSAPISSDTISSILCCQRNSQSRNIAPGPQSPKSIGLLGLVARRFSHGHHPPGLLVLLATLH